MNEDFISRPMATTTHLDLELGGVPALDDDAEIVRVLEKKKKKKRKSGEEVVVVESVERDCRICHLSLESVDQLGLDAAIVLGCSCKGDLAAAHKLCAEAWFKIKGNKTCEICGALARNVSSPVEPESVDHWDESSVSTPPPQPAPPPTETQNFWKGHRFLNFLLACMVFAFVISWLFHFNIHLRET